MAGIRSAVDCGIGFSKLGQPGFDRRLARSAFEVMKHAYWRWSAD